MRRSFVFMKQEHNPKMPYSTGRKYRVNIPRSQQKFIGCYILPSDYVKLQRCAKRKNVSVSYLLREVLLDIIK